MPCNDPLNNLILLSNLIEKSYGESCDEGVQCSHMLSGAECLGGVCTCAEEYTYLRGRCRQLGSIGSPCSDVVDCAFGFDRESVICQDNICTCSDGYYSRTENICRRVSMSKLNIVLTIFTLTYY